jgi:hypothetical protein
VVSSGNDDVRTDDGAGTDDDVRADHRVRTDLDVVAQVRARLNARGGVNLRHRALFALRRRALRKARAQYGHQLRFRRELAADYRARVELPMPRTMRITSTSRSSRSPAPPAGESARVDASEEKQMIAAGWVPVDT